MKYFREIDASHYWPHYFDNIFCLQSGLCPILAQLPFLLSRKYFLGNCWTRATLILANTCSISFSDLAKILFKLVLQKIWEIDCSALLTSTVWRFFLKKKICFFSGLHSSSRIHCNRVAFAQYLLRHLVPGLWSWLFSPCCPLQPYLDRKQRT